MYDIGYSIITNPKRERVENRMMLFDNKRESVGDVLWNSLEKNELRR